MDRYREGVSLGIGNQIRLQICQHLLGGALAPG